MDTRKLQGLFLNEARNPMCMHQNDADKKSRVHWYIHMIRQSAVRLDFCQTSFLSEHSLCMASFRLQAMI